MQDTGIDPDIEKTLIHIIRREPDIYHGICYGAIARH
jgi:hypothetical protein